MANLDFCDKHNMVAYLQKSEGSEGFHQLIDFLSTSHIKYALTEIPTIYVSLIEQFWQTAFVSTPENREMEITATIDGKVKVVSEASIRRHLKLEASDGISTLPNAEIFEQLALMGVKDQQSQLSPITHPLVLHPPHNHQLHHHLCKQHMLLQCPHDSPILRFHSLRSDEGSLTLNELTVLCTQLSTKVASLQEDFKQTKKVYGNAYTKLILKVKKLEKTVKTSQARRRAKLVVFNNEEDGEDSSK
ncbi:hypothetical protein Tco_1216854 [Tanacetum coccineum]